MKNLKRFLVKAFAGILSASVVLSAAACSTTTNKPQSGVLTIRYFEGGYGTEWLEYAAKKYQEEHPGFKYQLYPDTQITNTVNTYLKIRAKPCGYLYDARIFVLDGMGVARVYRKSRIGVRGGSEYF